jgi:hypothetical protein
MNSFASLAMIGAVSSVPDLARESSDEEDDIEMNSKDLRKHLFVTNFRCCIIYIIMWFNKI